MPDQSVSTSQAEAVTQPTEISSSVTSSAPQPSYKVGDKVRNTVGKWEGKVVEIDVNKIKVFGTSCSAWYDLNSSSFELILKPVSAYVPAVGDVVEFEYGSDRRGVIFLPSNYQSRFGVAYDGSGWDLLETVGVVKKTGFCKEMPTSPTLFNEDSIGAIAKAYFSAPTLTGTYAERQAQWIEYYKAEEGDKFKVVRGWTDNEDGYNGSSYDMTGTVVVFIWEQQRDGIYARKEDDNCTTYLPYFVLEPVK